MAPYLQGHDTAGVLFGITLGLWLLSELRQAIRSRSEAAKTDHHSVLLIRLGLYLAFTAAALSSSHFKGATLGGGAAVFAIGFVLTWLGIALRWWAFLALGRYFTITVMTSADQPVISSGPYRYVRHPSYTGLSLLLPGIGIMFGSWVAVAALAVLPLPGLFVRIRVEEAALHAALGARWDTYAQGRNRLVPHVW